MILIGVFVGSGIVASGEVSGVQELSNIEDNPILMHSWAVLIRKSRRVRFSQSRFSIMVLLITTDGTGGQDSETS
jgi:hypothetical protein